ncbi:MAG: hypothetical protein K8U03_06865 [Planctomycetia bacterium]|nr:hypothetical protein [Planctomycetia bacterium]
MNLDQQLPSVPVVELVPGLRYVFTSQTHGTIVGTFAKCLRSGRLMFDSAVPLRIDIPYQAKLHAREILDIEPWHQMLMLIPDGVMSATDPLSIDAKRLHIVKPVGK